VTSRRIRWAGQWYNGKVTKVKWSLCLTKYHEMETYTRSAGTAPCILNFGTRWKWVVQAPAALPSVPIGQKAGWDPEQVIAPAGKWTPDDQLVTYSPYWLNYPGPIVTTDETKINIKFWWENLLENDARWRQYDPPKRRYPTTSLHGVTIR
jgi:hypothetical protein